MLIKVVQTARWSGSQLSGPRQATSTILSAFDVSLAMDCGERVACQLMHVQPAVRMQSVFPRTRVTFEPMCSVVLQ